MKPNEDNPYILLSRIVTEHKKKYPRKSKLKHKRARVEVEKSELKNSWRGVK